MKINYLLSMLLLIGVFIYSYKKSPPISDDPVNSNIKGKVIDEQEGVEIIIELGGQKMIHLNYF